MKFKLRATAGRLMLAGAVAAGALVMSPGGVDAASLHPSARTVGAAEIACARPVSAGGAADRICVAELRAHPLGIAADVDADEGESGPPEPIKRSRQESDIGIVVGAVLVAAGSAMSLLARRRMN